MMKRAWQRWFDSDKTLCKSVNRWIQLQKHTLFVPIMNASRWNLPWIWKHESRIGILTTKPHLICSACVEAPLACLIVLFKVSYSSTSFMRMSSAGPINLSKASLPKVKSLHLNQKILSKLVRIRMCIDSIFAAECKFQLRQPEAVSRNQSMNESWLSLNSHSENMT